MTLSARSFITVLIGLMLLGACGQKGPLFLPGDPSQVSTDLPGQVTTQQPVEDDDEKDEDEEQDDKQP